MPQFYHDIITEKSFVYLQDLKRRFDFILIGGWAVYLYTHSLKSKDIYIIIDYGDLAKMKEVYKVTKNDRLKKYEIKTGEFDVDIYLEHYSELGIDITEIKKTHAIKGVFWCLAPSCCFYSNCSLGKTAADWQRDRKMSWIFSVW